MTHALAHAPSRALAALAVALAAALALSAGLWLARPDLPAAVDQAQDRLDGAAPAPGPGRALEQSFVAAHDGLSRLEVLAVVPASSQPDRLLTLRLLGPGGDIVAAADFRGFKHNDPLRLTFAPQPHSSGAHYRLRIEAPADQSATVWAYSLDGYPAGQLSAGREALPGDLRFSASYTYLPESAVRDAAAGLAALAGWALPGWLVLFAPGLVLLRALRQWLAIEPAALRWAIALGLSLSIMPLAWLWLSAAGLAWSPAGLNAVYIGLGLAAALLQIWDWRRAGRWPAVSGTEAALAAILVVSWLARWLAIRDLALPAWVDSPHHMVIARLLAETGRLPAGYQPVLPVDTFTYHFGFHAAAVALHWLTGRPLAQVFLQAGQILNALAALAAAGLTLALTRRPRAALAAAAVVGLVSLFPAYYLAWGRYTQLTGLLILAPLAALTWRLVERSADEARAAALAVAVLLAALAAGLVLAHYRILLFYLTFAAVTWALARGRGWPWLAGAAAGAALLAGPWLGRLFSAWVVPAASDPASLTTFGAYNDFPFNYFHSPLERAWLAAAGLALLAGAWKRERGAWALGLWLALTFGLLNLGPSLWLVNNNSWAISLFLPASAALGWGLAEAGAGARALLRSPSAWRAAAGAGLTGGLAGAMAAAGILGLRAQVAVSNPATVLAAAADVAAIEWVAGHTPPEALFLVNSWKWSGEAWSSPDGGAWLWALAGRPTTMPPLDYWYQPNWVARVRDFNERLNRLSDADSPEFLDLVRTAGVQYVFIGARGGTLKPEMFAHSPHFRLAFTNGAAWVFALAEPAPR